MAATYPLEVVEAARWTQANPNLKGDAAVQAVKGKDWDVSVKSLVAFPQTLAMMNNNLDWTQKLGDAMIGQQKDVADSIQRLRAKAAAAGNLKTTPQQKVTTQTIGLATAPSSSSRPIPKSSTCRTTTRPGRTGRGPIPPIRRSTIRRRPTTARRWRPA